MREINVAGLDLNLVPALDALLRRLNVSRAAEDVGLSQPAMSRALARLRNLHDDQLLVRNRSGYVLTPHAIALKPRVALAVASLRELFHMRIFDPALEKRLIRIAAADNQIILIMPNVMARLALDAPGVDVRMEAPRLDVLDRLDNGELDLAFALSSMPLPPGVQSEILCEDQLALVMRRGHPAAGRIWTQADYGLFPHVGVALIGDGLSDIDTLLAAHGVTRRMPLVTPNFMAALASVAVSDMVTTMSAALARRFAAAFDLVLITPPFEHLSLQTTVVYSHVRASDPFLAWFRSILREAAAPAFATTSGSAAS